MRPGRHTPDRPERTGLTPLEMLIVMAILTLLASMAYPMLARALRSTVQVTGRASMQAEQRLSLDWVTRDIHQAHVILEVAPGPAGALAMFRSTDTATLEPELVVEANRTDPAALPQFPFAGDATNQPLPDGKKLFLPGALVRYQVVPDRRELVRSSKPGRLAGSVGHDPAAHRSTVTSWAFEPSPESPEVKVVAANVARFDPVAVAYDARGFLALAGSPVTSACAVAVTLVTSAVVEGDRPEAPVVESSATKAWLQRRLSEAAHPGAAAAFDEALDH